MMRSTAASRPLRDGRVLFGALHQHASLLRLGRIVPRAPHLLTTASASRVFGSKSKSKEILRARRHELYTLEHWEKHRSGERYLRHLTSFFESTVVRGIMIPVLLVTLLATAVAGVNLVQEVAPHMLASFRLPQVTIEPIQLLFCAPLPYLPLQLTSFALSLLLVFRTNASYSRFMDARANFGRITTVTRDIARQAFFWLRRPEDVLVKETLTRWLVAFSRSCMVHVRKEHELREELSGLLLADEVERVAASPHAPMYCLQVITWIIHEAKDGLPQELLHRLDENVSSLAAALFSCERILNTPIPLSYTRHTSRFLIAWLTALPFCLWRYCHVAMVPIAMLIAFVLLGIEEIGVYIEEPFSVLPLKELCGGAQRALATILRESAEINATMKVRPSPPPVSFQSLDVVT